MSLQYSYQQSENNIQNQHHVVSLCECEMIQMKSIKWYWCFAKEGGGFVFISITNKLILYFENSRTLLKITCSTQHNKLKSTFKKNTLISHNSSGLSSLLVWFFYTQNRKNVQKFIYVDFISPYSLLWTVEILQTWWRIVRLLSISFHHPIGPNPPHLLHRTANQSTETVCTMIANTETGKKSSSEELISAFTAWT